MDTNTANLLRKRIFTRAALATVGTFILNTIGVWLSVYSILWWYDMPMHYFGGLFTALLVISFLLRYSFFQKASIQKVAWIVISITLLIGLVWEGYEVIFALMAGNVHLVLDSISDLFFDMAGAVQAVFIYHRHLGILSKKSLA